MVEVIKGYESIDLSIVQIADAEGMHGPDLHYYAESQDIVAVAQTLATEKKAEKIPPVAQPTTVFVAPITERKHLYFLQTNE
jgi:hypothetical protein